MTLERSFIVIVCGFLGVVNLSTFVTFLGLTALGGCFLTGVPFLGVTFLGANGYLGDLAFGEAIFLIGVATFLICLDLVNFPMSAATIWTGDFALFLSILF